jgi:hypothetical protein
LKQRAKRLAVKYQILACDRLPVSEDGITNSYLTLPADHFNNRRSLIIGHNESVLVHGHGRDSSWHLFTHIDFVKVGCYDPIRNIGPDFAIGHPLVEIGPIENLMERFLVLLQIV